MASPYEFFKCRWQLALPDFRLPVEFAALSPHVFAHHLHAVTPVPPNCPFVGFLSISPFVPHVFAPVLLVYLPLEAAKQLLKTRKI
jgi:hypothetical protein